VAGVCDENGPTRVAKNIFQSKSEGRKEVGRARLR
jgi:hypothetical protein